MPAGVTAGARQRWRSLNKGALGLLSSVDGHAVRLPDAGLPELVISEDLSNLPEGQRAVNPLTGEVFEHTADPERPLPAATPVEAEGPDLRG